MLLICMTSYHAIFEFLMTHVGKKVKIIEILSTMLKNASIAHDYNTHLLFLLEAFVFAF